MELPLAYYGDAVLRKKTTPVEKIDDFIKKLVQDMEVTMEKNDGCGLAAPQVHHSIALFITRIPIYDDEKMIDPGVLKVFINPKIISYSPESWVYDEACLSIPKLRGKVERPLKVTFEATNLDGERFTEEFIEFNARVMMHENDHINGVLYIDRIPPKEKKLLEPFLRNIKKKYSGKKR